MSYGNSLGIGILVRIINMEGYYSRELVLFPHGPGGPSA
jgi:hypothetical protein